MPRIFLAALALILPLAAQDDKAAQKPSVTAPSVIRKVSPKYSEKARKKKIEGSVVLKVVVSTGGRARDIQVMKSLDPELDENAIAAVREYVFKPGTRNGEPVAVYATVEVAFRLSDP